MLLPPHISQDIFHPNFLKPLTRQQTADRLAELLHGFGWIHPASYDDRATSEDGVEDGVEELAVSLPGHKETGITVISHSKCGAYSHLEHYRAKFAFSGSYTHAWMLKEYPKIIGRSCFVDPVAFCSWEGGYPLSHSPSHNFLKSLM